MKTSGRGQATAQTIQSSRLAPNWAKSQYKRTSLLANVGNAGCVCSHQGISSTHAFRPGNYSWGDQTFF